MKKGIEMEQLLFENDLSIINSSNSPPTFDSVIGKSWIDITCIGHNLFSQASDWNIVDTTSLSYHRLIQFQINATTPEVVKPNIKRTEWKLVNNLLNEKLKSERFQNLITGMEINNDIVYKENLIKLIRTYLQESVERATPTPKQHKYSSNSWWSNELSIMRAENNNLRRLSQRHRSSREHPSHASYKRHSIKFKSAIKSAKWKDFTNCITSCNDPWKFARMAMKEKNQSSISSIKKDDGTLTKDIAETASVLLDKFFPDDNEEDDTPDHKVTRDTVNNFMHNTESFEKVPSIKESEMKVLFEMDPYKAAPDDILPIFYQKTYDKLMPYILRIFNKCLHLGKYPRYWKLATVKIHPKGNAKDMFESKSYRPISLLPIMGKWFSKIINKRIQWSSENEDWIDHNQFGFREGKSCEKALFRLTKNVERCFNNKDYCLVISLDISGAFDGTWHPSILKSLIKSNCHPNYIHLINSFLNDRHVSLKVSNITKTKKLSMSCPQGEIHSPFLWNIDFNDIFNLDLSDDTQAFADDANLVFVSNDPYELERKANQALTKLYEWSISKKLKFNTSKTAAVIFTKKYKCPYLRLEMNNAIISVKRSLKSLGVQLDDRLNYQEHISNQCEKAKKVIFSISKYCTLRWGLSRKIMRTLWEACVEPILIYACPVWIKGIQNIKCRQQLESVQRLIANKMIKGFKSISYEAAIALSGLQPIIYRIHQKCLKFVVQSPDIISLHTETARYIQELANMYNVNLHAYEKPVLPTRQLNPIFTKELNIIIEDKEIAKSNRALNDVSNTRVFTDGSKMKEGTGCAVVICQPHNQGESIISCKLQNDNSIYQAELFAILLSLAHIKSENLRGVIHIFSDSRSSLEKLKALRHKSELLFQIQKIYQEIETTVILHWCPGHENIEGNEKADYYAKLSIRKTVYIEVPLPLSALKEKCRKMSKELWETRWNSSDNASVTKNFFPNLSCIEPKFTSCHEMTQILTGHSRLNYDLQRHGLSDSSLCRCGEVESPTHFLFWCPNFDRKRRPLIKWSNLLMIPWPPSCPDLVENPVLYNCLLEYLKSTKRLSF